MHILDTRLARKSNVFRKSATYGLQFQKKARRIVGRIQQGRSNRPIIVNSIPKSGTHLLMQVARALPGTLYYGGFVAQNPSLSLRRREDVEISRKLYRVIPGEVVGAHLHYSGIIRNLLSEINALHLMIVRDPVDVLLSEAYYLGGMNPFHRMAREFKGLNESQRINLALYGSTRIPALYPAFPNRITPYLGWLHDPSVMVVRYEELEDLERRRSIIESIVAEFSSCRACDAQNFQALVEKGANSINREKSHTASNRPPSACRDALKAHELLAGVRASLGYE